MLAPISSRLLSILMLEAVVLGAADTERNKSKGKRRRRKRSKEVKGGQRVFFRSPKKKKQFACVALAPFSSSLLSIPILEAVVLGAADNERNEGPAFAGRGRTRDKRKTKKKWKFERAERKREKTRASRVGMRFFLLSNSTTGKLRQASA